MSKNKIPYPTIDTPSLLLDLNKLEANINRMSSLAKEAGVRLRPHIKIHESAEIARMQIAAGACGVEVGPVAQAESMVNEGIKDIKIAHPGYYGNHKGETLRRILLNKDVKISIVIDMYEQAEQISRIAVEVDREVPLNIKIDTSKICCHFDSRVITKIGIPSINIPKIRKIIFNISNIRILLSNKFSTVAAII